MEEENTIYMPDNQQVTSFMKDDQVRPLCKLPDNSIREREEKSLVIVKKLPPDHLTATYWG